MSEHLEDSFVPDIQTPRLLFDLAAEAFAYILLDVGMPIIATWSYKREEAAASAVTKKTNMSENFDKMRMHPMMIQLNRLKSWYWKDMPPHFGDDDSKIRCAVGSWLLELSYVNQKFRNYEPLHRYALQLLFAPDVGNLKGMTPATIQPDIGRQFSSFLLAITPFYIGGLYDNSIKFVDPRPVCLVMLNSALRRVHLSHNLTSTTMDGLRLSCRNLESITFDISKQDEENHIQLESSGDFFRLFYDDHGSAMALQALYDGGTVPKTFQRLKEVCFRCDHVLVGLSVFVQTLNHVYPGVNLKLSCLASVPYGRFKVKYPFVCPTYQVYARGNGEMVVRLFFFNVDIPIDEFSRRSQDSVFTVDTFCHTVRIFVSSAYFMQDVMSMLHVRNLRYIFSDNMKLHTVTNVPKRAENIHDLFVFGPIPNDETDKELVEELNRCPNLDVLGFMIKPMTTPILEGLKPLTNLKVLSVLFTALRPCGAVVDTRYTHCQGGPLTEKEAELFTQLLIMAAPNLEVLEATCIDNLQTLIRNGYLQKLHTFSVVAGNKETIKSCIMSLTRLKVVLFDQFIDYDAYLELKRYFYYSKLRISYKNGRLVHPFIIGP